MSTRCNCHNQGGFENPCWRYDEGLRCYIKMEKLADRLIGESEAYADKAAALLDRAEAAINSSTALFNQGVLLQNQANDWLQTNGALFGFNVIGCSGLLQTVTTLEANIINTYAPAAASAIEAAILAVSTLNAQTLQLNQAKDAYRQCVTPHPGGSGCGCGCGGNIPPIVF